MTTAARFKVLFVSHKHPWPLVEGSRHRLYHAVQALATNHSVTLLTLLPRAKRMEGLTDFPLAGNCDRVIQVDSELETGVQGHGGSRLSRRARRLRELFFSGQPDLVRRWDCPELLSTLHELKRTEHFDVVWVARSYIAEIARRAGFERIVVDVDDIETISATRRLRLLRWSPKKLSGYVDLTKLRRFERSLPRRYWRLVVCKDDDRDFFGSDRDRVFVVPNGVADFPATRPDNEVQGRLLFLGTMGYGPNIDAVQYFCDSILARVAQRSPGVSFHVIGRNVGPEVLAYHDGKNRVIHGFAEDVAPHFEAASVVVAPIRLGSGTRLKVLEALARRKAVVATSTAIEGLDLRAGVDLEVADDAAAFAAKCACLLGDARLRRSMAESGRNRVLARYRWESIGHLVRRVLSDAGPTQETSPTRDKCEKLVA
jgi:polysaccharide biosynthesis protein PslH